MNSIKELYKKCIEGIATNDEISRVHEWLTSEQNQTEAQQMVQHTFTVPRETVDMNKATAQAIFTAIVNSDKESDIPATKIVHRIHFLKTAWFKYAAAAIIVLSLGAYLWSTYEKKNPETAKK